MLFNGWQLFAGFVTKSGNIMPLPKQYRQTFAVL